MRVLWILSADPTRPPDGQLTYSTSTIRALAAAGADVTVAHLGSRSPAPDPSGRISWRPAGSTNRNRIASLVSRLPAMAYTAGSEPFRQLLLDELQHPWDAVVIDHVQSGWALEVLERHLDPTTVLVHASQNDERGVRRRIASGTSANPAARLALELDARKVGALEDRILQAVDLVTAITSDDAAAFVARRPGLATLVIPPGYDGERIARRVIDETIPRRAVIAGSLAWRVKQHDLLALLRVADPRFAEVGAEIVVVGSAPADFEAEVAGTTRATRMLGRVDSFAPAFADARLALVSEPNGGGFKLKTLDYVFHRVPMLVQTGSVAGLPLNDRHGLLEFATLGQLVDGALATIDDFATLNRLQDAAYETCRPVFDWASRGNDLLAAISAAADSAL